MAFIAMTKTRNNSNRGECPLPQNLLIVFVNISRVTLTAARGSWLLDLPATPLRARLFICRRLLGGSVLRDKS